MAADWADAFFAEKKISRAKELVRPFESDFNRRLASIRASFLENAEKVAAARRESAEKESDALLRDMKGVAVRMKDALGHPKMSDAIALLERRLADWRAKYAEKEPDLAAALVGAEKDFRAARGEYETALGEVAAFAGKSDPEEIFAARSALRRSIKDFAAAAAIVELPYSLDELSAFLKGITAEAKTFAERFPEPPSNEAFATFLEENVVAYSEAASFYSLYGVYLTHSFSGNLQPEPVLIALTRGNPKIENSTEIEKGRSVPSKRISGDIVDLRSNVAAETSESIAFKYPQGKVIVELTPPSMEIRDIVDIGGRAGLSPVDFESELLKLVAKHSKAASEEGFIESQTSLQRLKQGVFPAMRRVQLISLYLGWLADDLGMMPSMPALSAKLKQLSALSSDMSMDGVPPELAWACLHDGRVRQKNAECAKFLASFPQDFAMQYREAKRSQDSMRSISKFRYVGAGMIALNPYDFAKGRAAQAAQFTVAAGVEANHPLYLLRKGTDGRLLLKKAIVPQNGKWLWSSAEIRGEAIPGEPLFQASLYGEPIDAEAVIAEIVGTSPDSVSATALYSIPYFKTTRGDAK